MDNHEAGMTNAQATLDAKLARCSQALTAKPERLGAGTLLVEEDAALPAAFQRALRPYIVGWGALTDSDRTALNREIRDQGWTLFLISGEVRTVVMGSASESRLRSAMGRILNTIRCQHFNAAEVTSIVGCRFWGIPYTRVVARARHIQRGAVLSSESERQQAQAAVSLQPETVQLL